MITRKLNLPETASVAHKDPSGRLHAPSAARNADAILGVMKTLAPTSGRALEIASGTGQHVVQLAQNFANITWQPSDVDDARLRSIENWISHTGVTNVASPIALDATRDGWHEHHQGVDLIILVNLLHLITAPQANTLIANAARALAPGGVFVVYGPFLRGEDFASPGDAKFHASLVAQNPDIGYKSDQSVRAMLETGGLNVRPEIDMPANNLVFATHNLP